MFKNFIDLLRFINLDDEDRRVMFYSENNNYWPHINDLLFSTADII